MLLNISRVASIPLDYASVKQINKFSSLYFQMTTQKRWKTDRYNSQIKIHLYVKKTVKTKTEKNGNDWKQNWKLFPFFYYQRKRKEEEKAPQTILSKDIRDDDCFDVKFSA